MSLSQDLQGHVSGIPIQNQCQGPVNLVEGSRLDTRMRVRACAAPRLLLRVRSAVGSLSRVLKEHSEPGQPFGNYVLETTTHYCFLPFPVISSGCS